MRIRTGLILGAWGVVLWWHPPPAVPCLCRVLLYRLSCPSRDCGFVNVAVTVRLTDRCNGGLVPIRVCDLLYHCAVKRVRVRVVAVLRRPPPPLYFALLVVPWCTWLDFASFCVFDVTVLSAVVMFFFPCLSRFPL